MNLLTRKKKEPKITVFHKTAKCPMCGRVHTVNVYEGVARYMDGTVQMPLKEKLSRYVMCECGLIYDVTRPKALKEEQKQAYFTALKKSFRDDEERKLILLQAIAPDNPSEFLWAQYYREHDMQEELQESLFDALRRQTRHGTILRHGCLPQIHLSEFFVLTPEYRKVDLLRQLGQFNAAKAQLDGLRDALYNSIYPYDKTNLCAYLDYEACLIRKKDARQC